MATFLKADKTTTLNGVKVNEYLLTKHNPNRIAMPTASMKGSVIGVTVHNTDWINVASATTPAEQYTRATVNGNMNDVRVHYYVDDKCAWQNLPLDLAGWHAADGQGNGNRKTIAIECIMSNRGIASDKNSEDNCARLTAYLLHKYGLGIDRLYTHTHWLNVKAGKKGSVDKLNTMKNSYKNCPAYILPHWSTFKAKVKTYLDALNGTKPVSTPTPTTTQTKPASTTKPSTTKKSDDEIAKEVIEGKWGNGEDRKKRLTSAGYNYNTIQRKVNALLSKPTPTKSITEIAKEVINGKWGNGSIRKQRLTKAGYDYNTVQREVNRLLK